LLQKPEKLIEKMFAMEFALEVAPLHGIDIIADWQKNNAGARSATDRYRAGSLESCLPAMCLQATFNCMPTLAMAEWFSLGKGESDYGDARSDSPHHYFLSWSYLLDSDNN
jgi:hypothetical protein